MCIAAAIAGSAVVGAVASSSAASKQANTANKAANLSQAQYEQTRQDQMPWMQSGEGALNRLNELMGLTPPTGTNAPAAPHGADFGKYARDFGMSDFTTDPGYAFRLAEGQKALDRSAAARGGLISGGALKAAQQYGQDMGSQEYTNAFNRYQTNRSNQLNPLQSMAGMGQTTAQQLGNAGQNYAGQAGAAYGAAGQAAASGIMGGANAISGGVGQYINDNQGNSLIAALNRGGTPSGYGAVVPVGANQYIG